MLVHHKPFVFIQGSRISFALSLVVRFARCVVLLRVHCASTFVCLASSSFFLGCILLFLASEWRVGGGWILMKLEIKQIHHAMDGFCARMFAVPLLSSFTARIRQYSRRIVIIPGFYTYNSSCGCLNVNFCSCTVTNSVRISWTYAAKMHTMRLPSWMGAGEEKRETITLPLLVYGQPLK